MLQAEHVISVRPLSRRHVLAGSVSWVLIINRLFNVTPIPSRIQCILIKERMSCCVMVFPQNKLGFVEEGAFEVL